MSSLYGEFARDRTSIFAFGKRGFVQLHYEFMLVKVSGLEPPASAPQTRRSS